MCAVVSLKNNHYKTAHLVCIVEFHSTDVFVVALYFKNLVQVPDGVWECDDNVAPRRIEGPELRRFFECSRALFLRRIDEEVSNSLCFLVSCFHIMD